MEGSPIGVGVGLVYLATIVGLTWRLMRRRKRYGPALTGTVHDLLNEDRRKAIELIVEEKAEVRDPEDGRTLDSDAGPSCSERTLRKMRA